MQEPEGAESGAGSLPGTATTGGSRAAHGASSPARRIPDATIAACLATISSAGPGIRGRAGRPSRDMRASASWRRQRGKRAVCRRPGRIRAVAGMGAGRLAAPCASASRPGRSALGKGSGCPEMAVVRRSGQRLAKHTVRASTWRSCTAWQRGAHSGRAMKALGKRARTSGAAPPSPKKRRNPARGRRRRRAGGGIVTAPMPPSTSARPAASRRPVSGGAGFSIPFHSPGGDSPQPDWPAMHTKGS